LLGSGEFETWNEIVASSEYQYGSGASSTYGTTPLLDVLMDREDLELE
jgi:hypothetical protein